ncbi:uncharacterized protein BX664DRAFT_340294 [Halteromyces radiatus]|uniref:uncharacterized protein n=1 Tax=Halteromyces radiatus TaxID=101107 RepID=UPI00221E8DF0|nr:uncharacterized protein BX664DRAFT_340294 [Halteromyces radiatus]KAI8081391.1 hypothetical protein BX664DRAFT_340294 [Halteromyces radiatus]
MTTSTAVTQEKSDIAKTMDQDLFQFFDSLSQPSPVGEWFTSTQDMTATMTTPASTHSSPEIATPLDIHLSPSAPKAEPMPVSVYGTTVCGGVAGDLDMSEILNSPIFDSPASAMTPTMTPATPHVDMFSELSQDLPSALAAFVAAVSTSVPPSGPSGSSSMPSSSSSSSLPIVSSTSSPVISSVDTVKSSSVSRKRSTPSTDDVPMDEAAIKRQKNTDAARRSRLKKVMKMESLEKRVQELERMNAQLLLRVAVLDSEKSHLQTKEATHESRIKTLESQLAEAHKALASRSS